MSSRFLTGCLLSYPAKHSSMETTCIVNAPTHWKLHTFRGVFVLFLSFLWSITNGNIYFDILVNRTWKIRVKKKEIYGRICWLIPVFWHFPFVKSNVRCCEGTFQAGAAVLALINTPTLPHSWNNDCSLYQKQWFFSSGTCGGREKKRNPSWCGNILSL